MTSGHVLLHVTGVFVPFTDFGIKKAAVLQKIEEICPQSLLAWDMSGSFRVVLSRYPPASSYMPRLMALGEGIFTRLNAYSDVNVLSFQLNDSPKLLVTPPVSQLPDVFCLPTPSAAADKDTEMGGATPLNTHKRGRSEDEVAVVPHTKSRIA